MPTADPETIYDEPTAPAANGSAPDPHACPECGQKFEGPLWGMRRGNHRRQAHGVVGTRQKERGGAPAGDDDDPEKRAPRTPPRARTNLAELGTGIWRGAAWLTARADKLAASRMFGLLAPAAGPAFDRAVKGTVLDPVCQPIARAGSQGKDAMILVGAPLTAQAFLDSPNVFTQAAFVGSLEASLPIIVRTAKEAKKRQEKMEADLSGLAEVFGKQPGESVTVREVANWVLTGSTEYVEPPPQQPEPEEATA